MNIGMDLSLVRIINSNAADNPPGVQAPASFAASVTGGGSMRLSWDALLAGTIVSIDRSLHGADSWVSVVDHSPVAGGPVEYTFYDVTGLDAGNYDFRVYVTDSGTDSAYATVTQSIGDVEQDVTVVDAGEAATPATVSWEGWDGSGDAIGTYSLAEWNGDVAATPAAGTGGWDWAGSLNGADLNGTNRIPGGANTWSGGNPDVGYAAHDDGSSASRAVADNTFADHGTIDVIYDDAHVDTVNYTDPIPTYDSWVWSGSLNTNPTATRSGHGSLATLEKSYPSIDTTNLRDASDDPISGGGVDIGVDYTDTDGTDDTPYDGSSLSQQDADGTDGSDRSVTLVILGSGGQFQLHDTSAHTATILWSDDDVAILGKLAGFNKPPYGVGIGDDSGTGLRTYQFFWNGVVLAGNANPENDLILNFDSTFLVT